MAKGRKHALTLEEVISRTAVDAAKVAQRVGEDIRGDILRLSRDLEIHRRAGDREKVEKAIRARIKRMNADLSRVMDVALGKAVKDANAETGLAVKYSADYTREILAMVQEQQGENLASVYSRKMEQSIIAALRNATVGTIQEAAVAGLSYGEQKKLMQERWEAACKGLGEAKFIDSGGHEWDSRDYFAMNVRTNAMRVYNDVLAGNVAKDGGDLVQVTRHGDPGCKQCFPWEGRILSLTGKTKGYPTYEECRAAGCFHPNCTHSIQTVDELIDAEEIELQRGKESPDEADDPMKAAFDLDVARKQQAGMGKDEAEAAVRRERLEAAARFGMPVEGAEQVVQGLTDGEVAALTDGVKVPKFSMAKRHEEPRFTPGSAGGHVVMPRGELTAEALKELPGVEKRLSPPKPPEEEPKGETIAQLKARYEAEGREVPRSVANIQTRIDAATDWLWERLGTGEGGAGLFKTKAELEQAERNFAKTMRRALDSGSFAMTIDRKNLAKSLESHFKNGQETGGVTSWRKHSSKILEVRRRLSDRMMGTPMSARPEEYEKYGYLASSDPGRDWGSNNVTPSTYGNVVVRFKKDKVLATFTMGDSLNESASGVPQAASLVSDPRLSSCLRASVVWPDPPEGWGRLGEGEYWSYKQSFLDLRKAPLPTSAPERLSLDMRLGSYTELQYHGVVDKTAIESISVPDRRTYDGMSRKTRDELNRLGVAVYVNGEKIDT